MQFLQRFINKPKKAIRKWFGLGDIFIGVDIGIKDESCAMVVLKQKGGQIRILEGWQEGYKW